MGTDEDDALRDETENCGINAADINKLMGLIHEGCEHEVLRHLDSTHVTPVGCMELFKNEECQSRGKYRGPVLEAAESGHANVVDALISRGFSPNEVNLGDEFKTQPIHVGCSLGHLDIVRSLVEVHGVSVDETDNERNTPLFYCFLNVNPRTYDIVKYLLEMGASVNWPMSDRITPLQECVATSESTPELCQLLIAYGADVNVDVNTHIRCTPLYLAAKKNRVDIVKVLLDGGADIEILDKYQTTAFMTATKYNHLPVLRYLYSRGANPEHRDKVRDTALHVAAQRGLYDIARYLIAEIGVAMGKKNKYNETPLLKAIAEVNSDIVNLLLKCGYSPSSEEINHYSRHYISRKNGVKELMDHLRRSMSCQRSLQETCIFKIRRSLGRDLPAKIDALQVPNKLKNMLRLTHL